jgi:myo-inositol-1(or 4)-monophosphatase
METKKIEELVEIARSAAGVASRLMIDRLGDTTRYAKSDSDLLDYATATDIECERRIRNALEATGIPVYGEEGGGADPSQGWCWIVDPIDGTKNWTAGLSFCGVSIGLAHDGKPIAGVVDLPFHQEQFWGIVGVGAWCDGYPIEVHDAPLRDAMIAYDMGADVDARIVGNIRSRIGRIRMLGSTAAELAWCAAGRMSAVLSPTTHSWDVAGGVAIVVAAGGVTRRLNGDPALVTDSDIVTGAPTTVADIITLLSE